jgi:hypothetical protein
VATSNTTVRPTKARKTPTQRVSFQIQPSPFSQCDLLHGSKYNFRLRPGLPSGRRLKMPNIFDRTTEAGPGAGARAHLFEGFCCHPEQMADGARLVHDFQSPFGAVSKTCDGIADHVRTRHGTFVPSRVVIWQIDARGTGMGTLADSEYITGHGGKLYKSHAPISVRCRTLELPCSRSLARRSHRPPAIKRHLLEQAAMFISPMSALQRITDSSRTARGVRSADSVAKVPKRGATKFR